MRIRAFNSKLDKAIARTMRSYTTTLSKTPLGALHWRVRFRRTVTYRPSIWILSRLPTCRSELGQPWHPPFPANPASCRPTPAVQANFTLDNSARFAGLSVVKFSQQSFWGFSIRVCQKQMDSVLLIFCVSRKIFNVQTNEGSNEFEMHFEIW